jgi:cytochrome b
MMIEPAQIKVWDLPLRVFHWSLALLFFLSYLTGDDSLIHVYSGYAIIGLIIFRLCWGVIGTRYARFSNFLYGRQATHEYAHSLMKGKPVHYIGHNPIGGWMIVALLTSLSLTCWSGLEAYGDKGHGPLAHNTYESSTKATPSFSLITPAFADEDEQGDEKDEFWEEIHELFANFTLFLVFIHLAGVVISSLLHRENLVRSMITGYKKQK